MRFKIKKEGTIKKSTDRAYVNNTTYTKIQDLFNML